VRQPDERPVLAQLFFTWAELDVLAGLVDDRIAATPMEHPAWSMLNGLRTALREAQSSVREVHNSRGL
jgi:hypothetical protein